MQARALEEAGGRPCARALPRWLSSVLAGVLGGVGVVTSPVEKSPGRAGAARLRTQGPWARLPPELRPFLACCCCWGSCLSFPRETDLGCQAGEPRAQRWAAGSSSGGGEGPAGAAWVLVRRWRPGHTAPGDDGQGGSGGYGENETLTARLPAPQARRRPLPFLGAPPPPALAAGLPTGGDYGLGLSTALGFSVLAGSRDPTVALGWL